MAFNLQKTAKNLLNGFNPDPTKAGPILLFINAMGMVFAALSNTYAAAVDKNTSAEDKKFLVPAGFATGVANIGLYYAMTTKIIDKLQGKKLKDGTPVKGYADTVLKHMEETTDDSGKTLFDSAVSKFATREIERAGKNKKGLFNFGYKSPEGVKEAAKTLLMSENGAPTKEAAEQFTKTFKSGFGVMGAFIGAVVGCAILTPIIRDVSAYAIQKMREKKNPDLKDLPHRPYFDPTHLKVNGLKRPMSMRNYMAFTHDKMRV